MVLQTLQLFTRECFLPTIQSIASSEETQLLQEKLRQLDVALQQTSLSTRVPHVVLQIHPIIEAAVLRKQQDPSLVDWNVLLDGTRPDDDEFLNALQAMVNDWIVGIRRLTTLTQQTPFPETAVEEVAFWTQLSTALNSVQEQLKSPGVEMTCALLREAKRFVATLALENSTGLEQAKLVTDDMVNFIKPFPMDALLSATTMDSIATAVTTMFDHLQQKVRNSRFYSLERSCQLMEATTMVLRDSMLRVLREFKSIVFMDYKEYESKVHFPALNVLVVFEERHSEWKDFVSDQGRRRKIPGLAQFVDKLVMHHGSLKQRLDKIHAFRSTQEQLRQVVHAVLRDDEPEAIQQVEQAPRQIFVGLDVLDVTPNGEMALEAALEEYDLTIDAVEERLAKLLREKLQACQVRQLCIMQYISFPCLSSPARAWPYLMISRPAGRGRHVCGICSLQFALDTHSSSRGGQGIPGTIDWDRGCSDRETSV